MVSINVRIKQRRNALGLTLAEIANYLGVKEATVQRYESGAIKTIKHETVAKLSEILRCDPEYLMGWQSEPSTSKSQQNEDSLLIDYFHKLDDKGRHAVMTVLKMELARVKRSHLEVVAAHSDDASDENLKLMKEDLEQLDKL